MGLESIVDISISNATVSVSRQGFGVPLILDYHTKWVDRYRTYSTLAGMVADGFATTDFAYRAAAALVAQNPRVQSWVVGRRLTAPTQTVDLTPTAVHSAVYTVTINATTFTYPADSATTVAEITAGLTAAINGGSEPVTATDNTTKVTLAADVAGTPFALSVSATLNAQLKVQNVTTDAGVATDLGDLLAASDQWYAVILTSRGKAEIIAAAAWIESNKRFMICSTADEDVRVSGSGDVASSLKTSAYMRSKVMWHETPHTFPEAAWMGKLLPKDPGSAEWTTKTLAGIAASTLSESNITQLKSKRAGYYVTIAGVNSTQEGHTAGGEWLDIVLGLDWTSSEMRSDVFALLASVDKVPYTATGIAMIEGVIRAVLQRGVNRGIYVDGSIDVSFPALDDISAQDKADRLLPDGTFTATLQGAIIAIQATGTVSV